LIIKERAGSMIPIDIVELGNQLKEFEVLEQARELNEMNEFR